MERNWMGVGFMVFPWLIWNFYAERRVPSGFEKELWKRFWELANDEKLAKERGVRAIHGDAPCVWSPTGCTRSP